MTWSASYALVEENVEKCANGEGSFTYSASGTGSGNGSGVVRFDSADPLSYLVGAATSEGFVVEASNTCDGALDDFRVLPRAGDSTIDGQWDTATAGTSTLSGTAVRDNREANGELITVTWSLTREPDQDGDGVPDTTDRCPTDPTNTCTPPPADRGTKRLAGTDRYATAAQIVRHSFPAGPVPVVFIATGEAFADALAGGPAAHVLGGPVLPVAKAGIPASTLGELDRLNPGRIVILGGPSAVSDAIAAQLEGYTDGAVTRLAGANRYATAANIAISGIFTAPVPQVLIATGLGFADALAGGAVGAKTNSPVLLVHPNSLPTETAAALMALEPRNIAVLGGTSAVSDAVLQQLRSYTTGGVNRLSGGDRYATAARLSQVFWPTTSDVVYLATGRNFPDALAGVPAAGRDSAPLLLVEPNCMPEPTRQELDRLQPSTIVVLGGLATVSDAAVNGASCVTAPTPSTAQPAGSAG